MDDMTTIEQLEIPSDVAEVALRKARAAQMTLHEYTLWLLRTDAEAALPANYKDLLIDGELPRPISDEDLADITEFRNSIKSKVTTDDILAAIQEGRPE